MGFSEKKNLNSYKTIKMPNFPLHIYSSYQILLLIALKSMKEF